MSYLGQRKVYMCDLCRKVETVSHFPSGWIWFNQNGVKHACESCTDQVPKEKHRKKGEIN